MKRTLISVLVVALLLGVVGVGAFAANYSVTRNVDDTFFLQIQWGAVPSYEESGVFSPVSYHYFYNNPGCSTGAEMTLQSWDDFGEVYVMICGNQLVGSGAVQGFETRDVWVSEADEYNYISAEVACEESQCAVKTQYHGIYYGESDTDEYVLTLVSPWYNEFYGIE